MGSKKRVSSTVEETENHINDVIAEPSRKKMKEGKPKKEAQMVPQSTTPNSINSMERRKKRKAMDKERHHSATDKTETRPKQADLESSGDMGSQVTAAASSNDLPEFHIGVFKDLASANVSIRESAAEALVRELQEVQKAYEKLEDKEMVEGGLSLEAVKDDGLNNCAPSLRYAIRRLIRGVSSSRECARQGFALGLTGLVGAVPGIKINSLLKLIVDLLEVSSSMKGQEVRDSLLGRLFAYGALARSGRLIEEWISGKKTSDIKEFTSSLISLAAKKRYLQEPAVAIILEVVEKLPVEALMDQVLEAPGIQEWFDGATEAGNPDALLLALKMREKISDDSKAFGRLLPYPYTSREFFSVEHLSSLATCLKESTFCQPRVHSVWPALVNKLLPEVILKDMDSALGLNSTKKHKKSRKSSSSEEEIEKKLQCFCEVIIEGSLLLSSHDRKHLVFDVLLLLLPRLPASCVSIVLSYKVIQCLMDILSTKDSWLYKVAQYFLKEVSDSVVEDDVRRIAVIVALQKHSNGKFDCITRTKTVKELMAEFKTESGCMLFIQSLINMFLDEGNATDEPSDQSQTTDDNSEIGSVEDKDSLGAIGSNEFIKSWVVESLPSILKYLKLDPEAKFQLQKEILKFLAVQGLFSPSLGTEVTSFELQEKFKWPKATTSSALCRMCIEQLQLLLANAQKGEGPHNMASGLEVNDLGSYFTHFVSTLFNIPSVSLFRVLSDEDETSFKELQSMDMHLSREERNCGLSSEANKLHALRYLLIQLLLQVLLHPGEFSEAASELIICCKKAFPTTNVLDSTGEEEPEGDGAPELMDVLVDTLLSLLPQSSAPSRSAIEQVFKYFCHDVSDDGLLRMLRVIKKDLKPARRQEADSDDHDDEEEDLLGIEEAEESDEAETGETGETDEQTDGSETEVGVEALGEEVPEDSDDDSDGGMDDEAMFRMDTYLARIFKEKKNQAGGETAQSQLVLFKLRVLSLLEIYLHENPGKPEVLKVFSNLSQAFINPNTTEGSDQLGQRIWGILQKKIFKAKECPRGEAVEQSMLESLLEKNLKFASKPFKRKKSASNLSKKKQSASWNRYKMINNLAKNSTYWILKIIDSRNFSESELEGVFDIFKGVLTAYFDSKKSQMKPDFLKEIFRRRPWIGHQLFGFLLEKCGDAKLQFRKVEGLDLVTEILKNGSDSDDLKKKMLKNNVSKICHLIKHLVTNMPEKQARRADVRKFCSKVFQVLTGHNLVSSFIKALEPEGHSALESQLGELFLSFTKQDR